MQHEKADNLAAFPRPHLKGHYERCSAMEIWKPIEGTNGLYDVSNTGKVRSRNYRMTGKEKILSYQIDNKGYARVRIKNKAFPYKTFKIHRLVASAFITNPDNKPQVNHINGNKLDNRAENLEWVTNQENASHAISNGLWGNVFAASSKAIEQKKTAIIATNIKTGEKTYFNSMSDAERAIGTKHINAVISGERKQAKGFQFEYAKEGDASCRKL